MSIVKADDVAYARFRAPDLDSMRQFLIDFGMIETSREPLRLSMRGYGDAPVLHVTEVGEAGFAGFAIRVNTREELEFLASHDNVKIAELDLPGGGAVLRLTDPDGFTVEVVQGQTAPASLDTPKTLPWNEKSEPRRKGAFRRIANGPSHVMRLGHIVLSVSNFQLSEAWYKQRFGFITSDEIQSETGVAIGAFMRADRGDERTCDHHTLFLMQHPEGPGFLHAAFEVVDMDDLMAGRDHLATRGRDPKWGIGRHLLGSQIFDYWTDPWGHEIEHWTDGDQLRAGDGGGVASLEQLMSVQWGMSFPGAPEDKPIG